MRTKDELFLLGDIGIMLQYLYMNENHRITFNNGITDLQIRMDENFNILCRNLSFPDVLESYFSSEMIPSHCLGVIQILQNMPPEENGFTLNYDKYNWEEHPNHFQNRWEEIKDITMINLSLNRKQVITILSLYKYTDKELEQLVKSIVILVDTREKQNAHIIEWLDKKKIPLSAMLSYSVS